MTLRPIETFGVLGAGTLGRRIALRAALSGYAVEVHDHDPEQLSQTRERIGVLTAQLVRRGYATEEELASAVARIACQPDREAFAASVDFVSESVTEDLELKRSAWSGFAGKWRPATVLTTNTSYLLPSQLAAESGDPDRFCAFHFHDVFVARVVDVMPHPTTSPAVVPFLVDLGRRLAQTPVTIARESPGYLFNHMLMAVLGAAGQLLADGTAAVEDIDRSWMGNLGVEVGPFGMLDQIGLDTVAHVLRPRSDRRSRAFAEFIAPMVARGELGVKSGQGFYTYPRPAYRAPAFLAGDKPDLTDKPSP